MSLGLPVWLFVSYGGGHVKALLPVALRVRDLGIARPVYLALTTAAEVVRAAGIETLGFSDFMTPADEAARRRGEELVSQLQVQVVNREESIAYLGLSYQDMVQRLGELEALTQYQRFGRQAFLPFGILERVIKKVAPSLVVATNSPRAEQAAIQTARRMGVASACLVDLLGIWERDLIAQPNFADAVCVLNESVRASLIAAGRPSEHVHATGNPAFDSLFDPALHAAGRAVRRDAGWEALHVCLYASSPEPRGIPGVAGEGDPWWPRRIEQHLLDAVRANPRLALLVRRHPSEALPDEIAALAHPRILASRHDMPLHAAIHAANEVIVTVSTVGVEASLAGKAVTQMRGSILDHLSPYLAMGIADRELRLEDIAPAFATGTSLFVRSTDRAAVLSSQPATLRVIEVLQRLQERLHG